MAPIFYFVAYLLATSGGGGGGRGRGGRGRGGRTASGSVSGRGSGSGRTSQSSSSSRRSNGAGTEAAAGGRGRKDAAGRGRGRGPGRGPGVGRKRYSRDGTKKGPSSSDDESFRQEELRPLPPLTVANGPRPSYFTCRHNYESTLIDEIQRRAQLCGGQADGVSNNGAKVVTSSPYPGLVRVEYKDNGNDNDNDNAILPSFYDPVYALQSIPQCVVVSAESIKGIAREVLAALLGNENVENENDENREAQRQHLQLLKAERGSLTIHPLVPGMCKGQANPIMRHRSEKVGEELSKMLKKIYPAARKAVITVSNDDNDNANDSIQQEQQQSKTPPAKERWALQVMLQSPDIAVASLCKCRHVGPGDNAYWPNILHPLGIAKVDIEERMPSSAYRKLMEGIECMGIGIGNGNGSGTPLSASTPMTTVVDLGACPGGWTTVMRKYFDCRVIAVDRSEVDPTLMKDEMVEFVKGDAFTFEPPLDMHVGESTMDSWMISDVIAYPERTTEMLDTWCGNEWARNMIVTMKFQGEEPDLDELDRAIGMVEGHGYSCRVKHFFNNKNEVTFMVANNNNDCGGSVSGNGSGRTSLEVGAVGNAMFRSI